MRQIHATELQRGILRSSLVADTVQIRILEHAHVQERVAQPIHGLLHGLDRAEHDLSVQVIRKLLDHLALHRQLQIRQAQVILQLGVRRHDDPLPLRVVLRPSRAPEHLEHIQRAQLRPPTLGRIVNLRPLDDDGVGRQVHAPRQRGRAAQDADVPVGEQVLDQLAIGPGHARMMGGEAVGEDFLEIGILHRRHLFLQYFLRRPSLSNE
mmetsp:Transcript_5223/g.13063  ORF Transcript_5223/g.13063 Transcript_5223/m.13063 type:complete len:209 (-) Transcript_5223:313-939(-)